MLSPRDGRSDATHSPLLAGDSALLAASLDRIQSARPAPPQSLRSVPRTLALHFPPRGDATVYAAPPATARVARSDRVSEGNHSGRQSCHLLASLGRAPAKIDYGGPVLHTIPRLVQP